VTNLNVSPAINSDRIRAAINDFLQERLQPKLDKLKEHESEKRQLLAEEHQPERWIGNAAKRVAQIQQVTHALKFTHPDARGTSLNAPGNSHAGELLVGTHSVGQPAPDVVGNAAALDVYKFLKVDVGGKTLLELAIEGDSRLQIAFSEDAEQARSWMAAFAGLVESKGQPTSHKLAKQLYWPVEGGGYHLLAPLFPTSLVHQAWSRIREDRFSEQAKSARKAYRERELHPHGFREYPDLAIRNFGGTKPQNISQLNSERYGESYLLASVPPIWRSERVRPPLKVESVFDRFERRSRVRDLIRILGDFLARVQEFNNLSIRNTRADLVAYLRDEVLLYASEIHDLAPGWTHDPACRLNMDEQCWLDPGRAEQDEAFAVLHGRADWKEGICKRFSNWLNAQLTSTKTPMGDAEAAEWRSVLEKEMRFMRMELDFND
jgi:CRISPR-associated protein Csy1